jgi:hypothetical protein
MEYKIVVRAVGLCSSSRCIQRSPSLCANLFAHLCPGSFHLIKKRELNLLFFLFHNLNVNSVPCGTLLLIYKSDIFFPSKKSKNSAVEHNVALICLNKLVVEAVFIFVTVTMSVLLNVDL